MAQFKPDFLIIPRQLYESDKVAPFDLHLYGIIYWLQHFKTGRCAKGNKILAKLVNSSPQSVQNSLARLAKAGFIKRLYKTKKRKERIAIQANLSFALSQERDRPLSSQRDTEKIQTQAKQGSKEDPSFNFNDIIRKLENASRRDTQIIGLYWDYKGYMLENKKQYQKAFKRELKVAGNLEGYSDSRILRTMKWLRTNTNFKWTLETVFKYIDEDLEQLSGEEEQVEIPSYAKK